MGRVRRGLTATKMSDASRTYGTYSRERIVVTSVAEEDRGHHYSSWRSFFSNLSRSANGRYVDGGASSPADGAL